EAKSLEAGRAEVLDEDVGLGGKLGQDGAPARGLEIDRDALLAAIDRQVIGGNPLDRGRHPGPSVVAAVGVLDLPDLGAEIRKRHGAPGPGEDPREVQHLDPVERRCHRYWSLELPSLVSSPDRAPCPIAPAGRQGKSQFGHPSKWAILEPYGPDPRTLRSSHHAHRRPD